jgi:hypothetical protein
MAPLEPEDMVALRRAKQLLENPGLTARLAGTLGKPIERGIAALPPRASGMIRKATRMALTKALHAAVFSLGGNRPRRASEGFHKVLVGASGGVGGVFGLAALPVELPVSTTLMLRSIADIARSEGHNIRRMEVKLSCLEVFALGGGSKEDDATESSYWAVRAALSKAVTEATAFIAERGVIEHTAPAILRLISSIASRFGVVVSEQIAAKAVPLVGAAGGSAVNILFMNHFQDMARGHFIVRRLEMLYGRDRVQSIYRELAVRVP